MAEFAVWFIAGIAVVALLAGPIVSRSRRQARARRADEAAAACARLATDRAVADRIARRDARREAALLSATATAAAESRAAEALAAATAEAGTRRLAEAEIRRTESEALRSAEAQAQAAKETEAQAQAELRAHQAAAAQAEAEALAALRALDAAIAEAAAEAPLPTPACSSGAGLAGRPEPKRPEDTLVLVADDSKLVRVKTGRLLAEHRYRVVFATDGLDAAAKLGTTPPDVLVTDVDMPGIDGFELTRRLRSNPRTAHVPVIMITAADDRHRADADRAGVDVLLGKPYPDEALIAHIRRAMERMPQAA
jgi:CheY-like chemotaxis protein